MRFHCGAHAYTTCSRGKRVRFARTCPLCSSSALERWIGAYAASTIKVKSRFRKRHAMRGFCHSHVEYCLLSILLCLYVFALFPVLIGGMHLKYAENVRNVGYVTHQIQLHEARNFFGSGRLHYTVLQCSTHNKLVFFF